MLSNNYSYVGIYSNTALVRMFEIEPHIFGSIIWINNSFKIREAVGEEEDIGEQSKPENLSHDHTHFWVATSTQVTQHTQFLIPAHPWLFESLVN